MVSNNFQRERGGAVVDLFSVIACESGGEGCLCFGVVGGFVSGCGVAGALFTEFGFGGGVATAFEAAPDLFGGSGFEFGGRHGGVILCLWGDRSFA